MCRGNSNLQHIEKATHSTHKYNMSCRDCKFIMGITSSNVNEILEIQEKLEPLNTLKEKYFANQKKHIYLLSSACI